MDSTTTPLGSPVPQRPWQPARTLYAARAARSTSLPPAPTTAPGTPFNRPCRTESSPATDTTPAGERTSVSDALGNTGHTTYDWAGNPLKRTLPTGEGIGYTYDAAGKLIG